MMSRMLAVAVALATPAMTSALPGPIGKVVTLLEDMKVQMKKDMADDKAVHEKLGCWCTKNRKEKTEAINIATAKTAQLQTFVSEAQAKKQELETKLKLTKAEVEKNKDAVQKAVAMRQKESAANVKEQQELAQAGKAVDQALTILKKKPSLVQIRAVARQLQASGVLALAQSSESQTEALQGFMGAARSRETFLGPGGYESQTGEVVGFLKGMKENFASDLKKSQGREKAAQEAFTQLKAAKEGEIKEGEKMALELNKDIAGFGEKLAQAIRELKDLTAQLVTDRAFLANLEKRCNEGSGEFDKRMKDRQTELTAVEDTVGILSSDEVFNLFSKKKAKAPSFLQLEEEDVRKQAMDMLSMKAVSTADSMPHLMLLAIKLQLDPLASVIVEVDKLVAELNNQTADDAQKKAWCLDSMAKNTKTTKQENATKVSLVAQGNDLHAKMDTAQSEIKGARKAIKEMEKQMTKASQNREKENKEFQQTVADQRLSREILGKALDKLRGAYAFIGLSEQGEQPAAAANAPPEGFKKYQKNPKGAAALKLIENIIADSSKAEKDAEEAETKAQKAYEEFGKNTQASIGKYNDKITNLVQNHAKDGQSYILTETSHNQTVVHISSLGKEKVDLGNTCNDLLKNFDATQQARAAEIKALGNVKIILSKK